MTEAAGATDNVVRRGERIAAVLTALKAHPDGMPARDALAAAADALVLSEFELGTYKNGDRRFEKLVRFETIEAVKTGWMIKDSGIWEITDEGAKALTRHATAADLARAAQRDTPTGSPSSRTASPWARRMPIRPTKISRRASRSSRPRMTQPVRSVTI